MAGRGDGGVIFIEGWTMDTSDSRCGNEEINRAWGWGFWSGQVLESERSVW